MKVDEKIKQAVASSGAQSASGWGASSGKSGGWSAPSSEPTILAVTGDADEVKEDPEHHRLVADKLELRFPESSNTSRPQDAVNKILESQGTSLGDMGASIHSTHNGYKTSVVTLKFSPVDGVKASLLRTSARNKFAPKNADEKRVSLLSVPEGQVACVIPMALYQKKRNDRLFRMRSNIADYCGLEEKSAEVDLRKRTISVGGKVVARQSIKTWDVHIIESALMSLVD